MYGPPSLSGPNLSGRGSTISGTIRGGLAATRREFMNGVPSLNPLRNDSGGTSRVERYSAARRIVRNTVGVATLR